MTRRWRRSTDDVRREIATQDRSLQVTSMGFTLLLLLSVLALVCVDSTTACSMGKFSLVVVDETTLDPLVRLITASTFFLS